MGIKPIVIIILIIAGAMTARAMGKQPVITKSGPKMIAISPSKGKQSLVRLAKDTVTDLGGSVLGTATSYLSDVASKSASTVESMVVDSTVGGIMKQVEKLPEKQQKEIKDAMCK
jgi:hypothetical protein